MQTSHITPNPAKLVILYIEDDARQRHLIAKVLAPDFEVITAENGLEGLRLAERRLPALVLTDLQLPDLNGEYVAARIRAMQTKSVIPVVAVSSDTSTQRRHRAIAAGCVGFLQKPLPLNTLAADLHEFIRGTRADRLSSADHLIAMEQFNRQTLEQLERAARQLQEDNAELRNLEITKSAFLTQVSHELRTPITVLSGYVQMLQRQLIESGQITDNHRELADLSVDSLKRLHQLMNEIVVMARLSLNQLDTYKALVKPGHIALDVIHGYDEALFDRKIIIETLGDAWNTSALADHTLLRMAFSNLLSNGIKFTPNGGKVTVGVEREGESLHIWFKDTGIGIHLDAFPLLFRPFYTNIDVTKGRTSKTQFMGMGMGLGLTIVTRIVAAHNGKLWAESPGYDEKLLPGSTFHLLLPIMELPPPTTTTP